jgi:uncharacterized hydrophobic protein (TIGR00271 family)
MAAPTNSFEYHRFFRPHPEVYRDAYEGRQFDLIYLAMLVMASLIALLGLLENSAAVIIGAMLISPLMGPILGCGLALTIADWPVGRKSLRNVLLSVAEVVFITAMAALLSPLKDPTAEILARTNPNLLDLFIALFSGAAGTLAMTSRKSGMTILPGVAIATAVVPPLSVAGYGLSTRQWTIAGGSLMLFFTNFAAIVLSAALVFLLVGFRPRERDAEGPHTLIIRYRIAIALLVIAALAYPLFRTLSRAARQASLRRQVAVELRQHFGRARQRQLDRFEITPQGDALNISAVVETAQYISPNEIGRATADLSARLGQPVRLDLQQLQLASERPEPQLPGRDYLGGGVVQEPPPKEPPPSPAAQLAKLQDKAQSTLFSLLQPAGVTQLTVRSLGAQSDGSIHLDVSAGDGASPQADPWRVAAQALRDQLSAPIRLHVDVLAPARAFPVHFPAKSERLPLTQLRRLRAFLRKLGAPPPSLLVVPSAAEDASLTGKRFAALRPHLPPDATLGEGDPALPAGSVSLVPVVHFEISSSAPAPSAPATPTPASPGTYAPSFPPAPASGPQSPPASNPKPTSAPATPPPSP